MRDEREWRDEVVIHSFHVAPFSHISRFTRYAGCSKRPRFSPAQPRRAKTRRSAGKAAASEESRHRLRYVEPLREPRTKLGERCVLAHQGWAGEQSDFFSILLIAKRTDERHGHSS